MSIRIAVLGVFLAALVGCGESAQEPKMLDPAKADSERRAVQDAMRGSYAPTAKQAPGKANP